MEPGKVFKDNETVKDPVSDCLGFPIYKMGMPVPSLQSWAEGY